MIRNSTLIRHNVAVGRFVLWLRSNRVDFPRTPEATDTLLCGFIETLWEDGEPKAFVGDAISGLTHFPRS